MLDAINSYTKDAASSPAARHAISQVDMISVQQQMNFCHLQQATNLTKTLIIAGGLGLAGFQYSASFRNMIFSLV